MAALESLADIVDGQIGKFEVITLAAPKYEKRWKEIVPVDTGRYQRSIRTITWEERISRHERSHHAAVGTDIGADGKLPPYPVYLEFGTSKMPPHPSALPAWRDTVREMEQWIRSQVKQAVSWSGNQNWRFRAEKVFGDERIWP